MNYIFLVLVGVILLFPQYVEASAITYDCRFSGYSSPEGLVSDDGFKFKITYDDISNEAFVVGNLGLEPVNVVKGNNQISFVEATSTGNVMITTIILSSFEVVHSRHSMVLDKFIPTQYYGECRADS